MKKLRWLWMRLRYGLRLERVEGMEFEYVLRSTRSLSKQDVDRILLDEATAIGLATFYDEEPR